MRHRIAGRKLDLPTDQRLALLRGLVRSLVEHEKIETTEARAKEARRIFDKMVTTAKEGTLHSRRQVRRVLDDEDLVKKLFDQIVPKLADRPGGYTRITRIGFRQGDAAPLVKLEITAE